MDNVNETTIATGGTTGSTTGSTTESTPSGAAAYPLYRLNVVDTESEEMHPVNAHTCARAVLCDDEINMQEHLLRLYEHVDDDTRHITAAERTKWDNHINDNTRHITAAERTKWNKTASDLDGKADLENGFLKLSQLPKSTKVNTTLTASGWASGKYTISNAAITATCPIELLPRENNGVTSAQMEALVGAMIAGGVQAAGSIQLVAHGDVPTVDIPVTLIIRRDL